MRFRSLVATLVGTVLVATLCVSAAGVAGAAPETKGTKVPLTDWVSRFCTTFAAYETDALAAAAKLQTAVAGVKDSSEGANATSDLAAALTKVSETAQAAATAATANGVPDVAKGAALAREIEGTLVDASKAYAKAAKKAPSLPTAPAKLKRAARSISSDLAVALAPNTPHAKRLKRLDTNNAVAKAISADPVCSAARAATGTTTPTTSTP
jgi:uncharacterized phage infection (PIP) family protein YhgE